MCLSIGAVCVCVYVYAQYVYLLFPIFPLSPLRCVCLLGAWLGEHNVIAANFTKQQIDDELML